MDIISRMAFVDELEKLGSAKTEAGNKLVQTLLKHKKPLGFVGGGAAGMHLGKGAYEDYSIGRQVRKRMQGGQ